jgi:hypothetical protein
MYDRLKGTLLARALIMLLALLKMGFGLIYVSLPRPKARKKPKENKSTHDVAGRLTH